MKVLKKALLIAILTVLSMLVITITSKAATIVKITGDTVNVRKGPSTDTKVVAMLSKGVECELLEEEEDWYKIQYKTYTGYVTKQYAEIVGGVTENNSDDTTSNNEKIDEDNKSDENTNNDDTQLEENNTSNENQNVEQTIVYKKLKQNTDIKILPLIHSSNIGTAKKGKTVTILTENRGWTYIQYESISGWIRTDLLENSEANNSDTNNSNANNTDNSNDTTDNTNNDESESTFTERTGYISESYVNMRKGAGTSYDRIKVLGLNYEVTIIGEEGTWYKIKSGDDTGYVSKEYVSDSKKVTTRSNTTARNENREEENETSNADSSVDKNESSNTQSTTTKSETSSKTESSSDSKSESSTSGGSKTESTTSTKTEETKTEQTTSKESSNTIKGSDVVAYAKKFLGYRYVYGGDGSDGTFDCSGFTMYVYKHFGISLLHGANAQYNSGKGTKISKQSDLQEGDIVFLTDYETGVGIGHCGIYIGNGNFIHASTATYGVIISSLNSTYSNRFYAGLRLI